MIFCLVSTLRCNRRYNKKCDITPSSTDRLLVYPILEHNKQPIEVTCYIRKLLWQRFLNVSAEMTSSFKDVTNNDVTARCRKPKHTKEENSKSKKDTKGYFYDNAENCEPNIYSYFARLSEKCARDNPER